MFLGRASSPQTCGRRLRSARTPGRSRSRSRPRGCAAITPSTSPRAATSRPSGQRAIATVANRAVRSAGYTPSSSREQLGDVVGVRRVGPGVRAPSTRRARRRARRPRARCRRRSRACPSASASARALIRAFSSSVVPVSSTSGVGSSAGSARPRPRCRRVVEQEADVTSHVDRVRDERHVGVRRRRSR